MNCWHCKTDLIWGGDHDADDSDFFTIVTNLSCPKCNSLVLVYSGVEEEELPPARIDLTGEGDGV
tara:strand:- start:155 stop:349 length:195 start_codon:yes stop_codon:yes gene_type:complete